MRRVLQDFSIVVVIDVGSLGDVLAIAASRESTLGEGSHGDRPYETEDE